MITETLRVHNVRVKHRDTYVLKDVSYSFVEGESVGFWGLSNSGKDALFNAICGISWPDQGSIYIKEQFIPNADVLKQKVHRIAAINYMINNWTVAEYIGLMSGKATGWQLNGARLTRAIKAFLDEINMGLDPQQKIKHLSEIEKRLMDLAKAYYNPHIQVLMIEDEFEGCTVDDMRRFRAVMDALAQGRMTVIINAFSDTVNQILADVYILFQGGTILKKVTKAQLGYKEYIESYLSTMFKEEKPPTQATAGDRSAAAAAQEAYAVKNLPLTKLERVSLSFAKYTTQTLLVLNKNEKERIFGLLSGRVYDKTVRYFIENRPCHLRSIPDFIKHKIVSCAHVGTAMELMPRMSVGENIILPSLTKIDPRSYLLWGNKMMAMLEKQAADQYQESAKTMQDRGTLSRIVITFERWLVYTPTVLLLLEPFMQCDAYGVSMIKSYIKQFTQKGTAVVIVTSCADYLEDVTDTLVNLEYL